jgi:hypothetical protein
MSSPYSPLQMAMLPLLGGLVCPAILCATYLYARRRMRLKETLKSRAYLFYRVLSGVLLGQFLTHTYVGVDDLKFMLVFVMIGYVVIMDFGESVGRIWNTNTSYVGPLDDRVSDEIGLDRTRMEQHSVIAAANISGDSFAETIWTAQDVTKDATKRRWMLGILLGMFGVVSIMDGLLLVLRNPQNEGAVAAIVVCYYVNGVAMSVAVYGAMLHAKIHLMEERRARRFWWVLVGGVWCVCVFCSAIPVLARVPLELVRTMVNHKAFVFAYGLAGGCILKLQQYYYNKKMEHIDKRDTAWGMLVFALAAAQSAVTGYFL